MAKDPTADPQYGERGSYLVVYGGPNSRLMDQVVSPEEFIKSKSLRLNGHYYITKQIIPSISRVFNLLGADVQSWYDEMPKSAVIMKYVETMENMGTSRGNGRNTIDQFFKSKHCLVCGEVNLNEKLLCNNCLASPQTSIFHLTRAKQYAETRVRDIQRICNGCSGFPINFKHSTENFCQSFDCPTFYDRLKSSENLEIIKKQFKAAQELFWY
ncbi:DNA polymerase zeta [Basidiobolus ranarum]|uniref:DNA-directed DNA polymerase n=1 Tax=Basidiobolus ranarum TaxID=34480 RepID=A0ABR2VT67_9FUNG